jgi:hypothetical protein
MVGGGGGGGPGLAWLYWTLAVNIGIHASTHHGRTEWMTWLSVLKDTVNNKKFVMKISSLFPVWMFILVSENELQCMHCLLIYALITILFQRSSNRLLSEHLMLRGWCHEILFEDPKYQISTFFKVLMVFTIFWQLCCEKNLKVTALFYEINS